MKEICSSSNTSNTESTFLDFLLMTVYPAMAIFYFISALILLPISCNLRATKNRKYSVLKIKSPLFTNTKTTGFYYWFQNRKRAYLTVANAIRNWCQKSLQETYSMLHLTGTITVKHIMEFEEMIKAKCLPLPRLNCLNSCNFNSSSNTRPQINFLEIPYEGRQEIWKYLASTNQLLQLRLVCKTFRDDIDYGFGLNGNIDTREKCYSWYQTKTVRTLTIHHLDNDIADFELRNLLGKPKLLRKLQFKGISPETVEKLPVILENYVNIRRLEIDILNHGYDDTGNYMTTDYYVQMILTSCEKMNFLSYLKVMISPKILSGTLHFKAFQPSDSKINKDKDKVSSSSGLPKNLKFLYLSIPDVSETVLTLVETLFLEQNQLEIFYGNVGRILWDFYTSTLLKNKKTLTKVCLENVQAWDSLNRRSIPFDFTCFSGMRKLKQLNVIAIPANDNALSISWIWKFKSLPVENIVELYFSNVFITVSHIVHIYSMNQLKAFRCINGGPNITYNLHNIWKILNRIRMKMDPTNFYVYDFKPSSGTQTQNLESTIGNKFTSATFLIPVWDDLLVLISDAIAFGGICFFVFISFFAKVELNISL